MAITAMEDCHDMEEETLKGEPQTRHRLESMVVGIGASAGGLTALKRFFEHIPIDSGLSFVVVVHLSPEHKSMLADLLQPSARLPVRQVTETMPLEPNNVYVIPPNANLSAIDTHLRLSKLEERRRERAPIDHFFRTLASTYDGHSIGVVLTGTGSDGTLGLKEIKAKGGLILVQDPNEAEFDGMPQSAIATGLVDRILPVTEIAVALLRLAVAKPRIGVTETNTDTLPSEKVLLPKVLAILKARTERDFSRYKAVTLLRRIARRMQLNYIDDFERYVENLREHPEEARALADDLLITVTSFFRDPEVFKKLERDIVPKMFEGKSASDTLRIWSVGCATGEEAYSVAMLLLEEAARRKDPPKIQIFASDMHKRSLNGAREGLYAGDIETDVSAERLARFFQKENGGYRVSKEVRDTVVFAPHNLLGDPPFSRLDLITCRNLLIYLDRSVQRDVIDLFHYALCPHGYLLLGSAETIDAADLFRTEDKKLCIYQKRNVPAPEPRLPVFPLTRLRIPGEPGLKFQNTSPSIPYQSLHQSLLEQYAPPSILVGPDNRVVHLSDHAGRYLMHPGGEVTSSVLRLVREDLRIELQALLQLAREKKHAVNSTMVSVRFNGHSAPVTMRVTPAHDPEQEGFVLIVFDERASELHATGSVVELKAAVHAPGHEAKRIAELEAELNSARQHLQTIIEEYETSQEEMKAANEEMQSTNEELRSTMEELETSKEELQSINEELQAVNQENRHKVEELSQLSSDLQNLLAATEIATLFLDRDLRILRFTPRLAELFNVRVTDRGRPISDLTHRLGYEQLTQDGQSVLVRLIPVEREIRDDAGRWYLTRVMPYRSTEDRIEGVVITFVEITARKLAEAALRDSEEKYRNLFNSIDEGFCIIEVLCNAEGKAYDYRFLEVNPAFAKHTGLSGAKGRTVLEVVPQHERFWFETYAEVVATGEPLRFEYQAAGLNRWLDVYAFRIGAPEEKKVAVVLTDVGEQRRAAGRLRESEELFRLLIENVREYALFQMDLEGRVTSWNPGAERLFGYSSGEMLGQPTARLFTPEDQQTQLLEREIALATQGEHHQETRWVVRKDGHRFWAQWVTEPVRGENGEVRGVAKLLRDESDRKQSEERQRLLMGELNHRVKNTLATVQSIANQMLRRTPDPAHFAERFQQRIQALARAHDLLTRNRWRSADVADIVREQVTMDGEAEGIVSSGPSALLTPQSAVALSLVLHELETNARKHGALSFAGGRVRIQWQILEPEQIIRMEWTEMDGPLVSAPQATGFGTVLVERSLESVNGTAKSEFLPGGLVCIIQLPIATEAGTTEPYAAAR
jgi:two-component system, chemotaxis family, CheB/CheR fusion protein